jgi:ketosteroid isomerase-like protein
MKNAIALFGGLLLTVWSCTPKTAVVNNDALIDTLNAHCAAAWNSGNPETAANFYAEDVVMTFQDNVTVSGRDSLLAFCKGTVPYIKHMTIYRGTYAVVNDIITETGLYSFDWTGSDNINYPNRGSYMTYWRKTGDNTWKPIMQINHQGNIVTK